MLLSGTCTGKPFNLYFSLYFPVERIQCRDEPNWFRSLERFGQKFLFSVTLPGCPGSCCLTLGGVQLPGYGFGQGSGNVELSKSRISFCNKLVQSRMSDSNSKRHILFLYIYVMNHTLKHVIKHAMKKL